MKMTTFWYDEDDVSAPSISVTACQWRKGSCSIGSIRKGYFIVPDISNGSSWVGIFPLLYIMMNQNLFSKMGEKIALALYQEIKHTNTPGAKNSTPNDVLETKAAV